MKETAISLLLSLHLGSKVKLIYSLTFHIYYSLLLIEENKLPKQILKSSMYDFKPLSPLSKHLCNIVLPFCLGLGLKGLVCNHFKKGFDSNYNLFIITSTCTSVANILWKSTSTYPGNYYVTKNHEQSYVSTPWNT